ncbi:condensation domain-containing protein [Williamsia phyllosphaerae]|uniref:Condensation domain-containing protein n=1 Tax=Williamsia phyllosphaerae TaxID=885042 RepID=A0ABQ1U7Z3_9NOCA|nr:condensation domain-containing protein [Williamsia phyllosphaerae]GGF12895.1 hypothetical protein GCM10007298_06000 [Williamsia phyllosphaerae]
MHSQLGMRDAQSAHPDSPGFQVGFICWFGSIDGIPPDVGMLVAAMERTLAETPALTVRLHDDDGSWTQVPAEPDDRPNIVVVDLSQEPDPLAAFYSRVDSVSEQSFELADTALIRVEVTAIDATTVAVAGWAHHIVVDGYGAGLFRTRLLQHYVSLLRGHPSPPGFFGDFGELVRTERTAQPTDIDYWVSLLADPPRRVTFAEHTSRRAPRPRRSTITIARDAIDVGHLDSGRPLSATLLAIVSAWTALLLGEDEAVIGVPRHNRSTPVERTTPSMMMTELPIRVAVPVDATTASLAVECHSALICGRPHTCVRPEDLHGAVPSAWRTGRVHGPSVNVQPFDLVHEFGGASMRWELTNFGPIADMTIVFMTGSDDQIAVEILTNPDLYTEVAHDRHVERLSTFIHQCVTREPHTPVIEHQILTADEIETHESLRTCHGDRPREEAALSRGQNLSPAALASAASARSPLSGLLVLNSRGRHVAFGEVGRVTLLGPTGSTHTDLLASVHPDGVTYHGRHSHRRFIRGHWVDLGAVADEVGAEDGVLSADVDPTRPSIVVVPVDPARAEDLTRALRPKLPRGVRIDVTDRAR